MNKLLLLSGFLMLFAVETQATVRYAAPTGTGTGTGSWGNASADLQLMINQSNAGDTVWAAAGVFLPIRPADNLAIVDSNNRDNSFVLKANVVVFGGFAGVETDLLQRDWKANPTILSGDIGVLNDMSDNCYHVVISAGNVGAACLDGFFVRKGNADFGLGTITVNAEAINKDGGGGIYISSSSPRLTHLAIDSNEAFFGGGGIYACYSSAVLTNVSIRNNLSYGSGGGGGIASVSSTSLVLINVLIAKNQASAGGGIHNSSPYSTIISYVTLTNVTISGNTATSIMGGGGIINSPFANFTIQNSILWGNAEGTTINSVRDYGTISYAYCWVEGLPIAGGVVFNTVPQFVSAANGDYHLQGTSPAIDYHFNCNAYVNGITTDLDGNPRIYNWTVDMGAYEYQGGIKPDYNGIIYVNKKQTTGDKSGRSWDYAVNELADALRAAQKMNETTPYSVLEIWVASSTYYPLYNAADGTTGDGGRDNAFLLVKSVQLFGGFPDTANDAHNASYFTSPYSTLTVDSARNTRNWDSNPTILSGQRVLPAAIDSNCYHVVIAADGVNYDACLDGFIVRKGNASLASSSSSITVNGQQVYRDCGGGIYAVYSSPSLVHLIIDSNSAYNSGGGVFNSGSSPMLTNVLIAKNRASNGGGMCNSSNSSANPSAPVLTNTTISGNAATINGGGMLNTGIWATPHIHNSIYWGNTASAKDTIQNENGAVPIYSNSLVGGATLSYGIILNDDPLFIDTAAGDYQLHFVSPAVDKGNASFLSILNITTDLRKHPRFNGAAPDLGAYESQDVFQDALYFSPLSFIYNGMGQAPAVTSKSKRTVTDTLYKEKGAADNTYTAVKPVKVGNYTIKAAIPKSGLYDAVSDTADFVILPRQLTVNTTFPLSKVYDGTDTLLLPIICTSSEIILPDDITITAEGNYDNKNVGTGKTIIIAYTLSGADSANYIVPKNDTITNGEITPKQLTISTPTLTKIKEYDGNTSAAVTAGTLSGIIGSEMVTANASANYDNKNVGQNKTIVVTYTLGGADNTNYLAPKNDTATDGEITPKQLFITKPTITKIKVYDGNTSAAVTAGILSGFITNDAVTANASANYDNKNVGTNKTIIAVYTLSGADSANYIAPKNDTVTDGEITPKQLFISGTTFITSKAYDGTDTLLSLTAGTLIGVISPDNVSVNAAGAYDNKNIGIGKTITIKYTLSGADAGNYIVPTDSTTTIGVIASQVAILTVFTTSKIYDGTDTLLSVAIDTLIGVVASEDVKATIVSAKYDNKNVGTGKTIMIKYALSGADAGNYLTPADSITHIGEIIAKTITVTANAGQSKVYGDADPAAFTYSTAPPLILPDTFTGVLSRTAGDTVGKYAITQGTLDAGNNYTIIFVKDSFSITPKNITITANAGQSKIYGDADPTLTYTLSPSLIFPDTLTGSLSREAGENVGKYEINQGTLSAGKNYNIIFVKDSFSITPKNITITANAGQSKTYGDADPTFTYTVTPSLIFPDTLTGSLSRDIGENVGKYEINQGTLSAGKNYNIIFIKDSFSITPKNITITANAGQSKIYGDADPILTYTVTPPLIFPDTLTGKLSRDAGEDVGSYSINQGTLDAGGNYIIAFIGDDFAILPREITVKANGGTSEYGDNPLNPGITATNLANGDTESVLTFLSNSFGIDSTTLIGRYEMRVIGTLTNPNYHITSYDTGTWIVTERRLTVKAVDEIIDCGEIPILAYAIVSGSLINGDTLSGSLYVDNYDIGIHTIQQGTLAISSNYQIIFIEGTLIVRDTDTSIWDILVNGIPAKRDGNQFFSELECGADQATITVICSQYATVKINGVEQNPSTVSIPNWGSNIVTITITATNGNSQTYTLTIYKLIPFDQVVIMRWNNTLTVINNPANNGGFRFTAFKFFRNDNEITTNQSWSISYMGYWLNETDEFYVELAAEGYSEVLRTCKSRITLRDIDIVFYPNPVAQEQFIYIQADIDDAERLNGAAVEAYNMHGALVETLTLTSLQIPISNKYATGTYLFVIKGKNGFRKEVKVVVDSIKN